MSTSTVTRQGDTWLRRGTGALLAALLAVMPFMIGNPPASAAPTVLELVQLGGAYSEALAVSGDIVVGYETTLASGARHAVAWDLSTSPPGKVDLPTLGGFTSSVPTAVDGNIVVGTATSSPLTHRAVAWDLSVSPPTVVDLGTLAGDSTPAWDLVNSDAVDVDGNIVVGYSRNGFGFGERRHAFAYDLGTAGPMVDLGTLGTPPGQSEWSTAQAVHGGVIVGTASTANLPGASVPTRHAFKSGPAAGTMVDLDPDPDLTSSPCCGTSRALATNGSVVVGSQSDYDDYEICQGAATSHAFASGTTEGTMVDLGTLDAQNVCRGSEATAVDGGVVVGWSETDDGSQHAFASGVTPGTMVDLGTLGGSQSTAVAVSGGVVVGSSRTGVGVPQHAFASGITEGTMVDLGAIDGGSATDGAWSGAVDVDGDLVVGWSYTVSSGAPHAVAWRLAGGTPPGPTSTSVAVSSSANPANVDEAVTYTATVDPVPDGGTVAFKDASTTITGCDSQSVDTTTGEATFVTGYDTPGTHSITAEYSGTSAYDSSTSSALTQHVVQPTSVVMASTSNPALIGQSVTYTAAVRPVPDGGTVAFKDGGTTIGGCGAQSLNAVGDDKIATCVVSGGYGSAGTRSITAEYSGSGDYRSSTQTLTQQVTYGVQLLYDPAQPSKGGGPIKLTLRLVDHNGNNLSAANVVVTVTGVSPSPAPGKVPSGTFTFRKGSYTFSLGTRKYPPGDYSLLFTAGADPTTHSAPFTVV